MFRYLLVGIVCFLFWLAIDPYLFAGFRKLKRFINVRRPYVPKTDGERSKVEVFFGGFVGALVLVGWPFYLVVTAYRFYLVITDDA